MTWNKLRSVWIILALLVLPLQIAAEESAVRIATVPLLEDNYAYILRWEDKAMVIDPSEDQRVWDYLCQEKLKLKYILNTHHHWDHVAGNQKLKAWSGCTVIGPDDPRIPCLDKTVQDGDEINLDGIAIKILFVPGHTSTHIAFYLPDQRALFTGDLLFGAGCGKIFEGTIPQMIQSFEKVKALPDNTQLFFGHEYTVNNLRFALAVEPKNLAVAARLEKVQDLRNAGIPSVPSSLGEEKLTNPFLRLNDGLLKRELGVASASPEDVFERIILLKQRTVPHAEGPWATRTKEGSKSRAQRKAN